MGRFTNAENILDDLAMLPDDIRDKARAIAKAEAEASAYRMTTMADTKEGYEMAVIEATMEASANDVTNGKNAEERKTQLARFLYQSAKVKEAKRGVRLAEAGQAGLDAKVEAARVEYKATCNEFQAAAYAATLKAALLNAVAMTDRKGSYVYSH